MNEMDEMDGRRNGPEEDEEGLSGRRVLLHVSLPCSFFNRGWARLGYGVLGFGRGRDGLWFLIPGF